MEKSLGKDVIDMFLTVALNVKKIIFWNFTHLSVENPLYAPVCKSNKLPRPIYPVRAERENDINALCWYVFVPTFLTFGIVTQKFTRPRRGKHRTRYPSWLSMYRKLFAFNTFSTAMGHGGGLHYCTGSPSPCHFLLFTNHLKEKKNHFPL